MALPEVKQRIWIAAKQNLYTIVIAASNIGAAIPVETEHDGETILKEINRIKGRKIEAGVQDRRIIPITPPRFERVPEEIPEWEDIV